MRILVGESVVFILSPMIEQCRLRRLDKNRRASMRKHAALGHRGDPRDVGGRTSEIVPLKGVLAHPPYCIRNGKRWSERRSV
jgi:hypothetical protein